MRLFRREIWGSLRENNCSDPFLVGSWVTYSMFTTVYWLCTQLLVVCICLWVTVMTCRHANYMYIVLRCCRIIHLAALCSYGFNHHLYWLDCGNRLPSNKQWHTITRPPGSSQRPSPGTQGGWLCEPPSLSLGIYQIGCSSCSLWLNLAPFTQLWRP